MSLLRDNQVSLIEVTEMAGDPISPARFEHALRLLARILIRIHRAGAEGVAKVKVVDFRPKGRPHHEREDAH